ncbi:hypothetical protein BH09BAC1_BH09BAC1_00170 [soil metagenome]
MKKAVLMLAVFAAVGFSSCKKDYTCTCTTSGNGITPTTTTTTINAKQSDAEAACDGANSSGAGFTTVCNLD